MSVTTSILDDGKRLVINQTGWKDHRQNLDQQLAALLTKLHGQYLRQQNAAIEDVIARDAPGFIAVGFSPETKVEQKARAAEIARGYDEAALAVVEAYHQAQIAGARTFVQLLPPLPFLGGAHAAIPGVSREA